MFFFFHLGRTNFVAIFGDDYPFTYSRYSHKWARSGFMKTSSHAYHTQWDRLIPSINVAVHLASRMCVTFESKILSRAL